MVASTALIHDKCGMPASFKSVMGSDWTLSRVIHHGMWCEQIIGLDGEEEDLISNGNTSRESG